MKIKKILAMVDTRKKAEVEGRTVALSGTGEKNTCALCGSTHEIHASVEFDNGSVAIVGVACAKKSSPVAFKRHAIWEKMKPIMDERARLLNLNHRDCVSGNYCHGGVPKSLHNGWNFGFVRAQQGGARSGEFSFENDHGATFEDYCITYGIGGRLLQACKKKLEKLEAQLRELSA